ncbi:MAG: hypothetical protein HOK21_05045 [Rhodospirillaceae bacterium]|nr:hypothetical protein [Rhodospirillaceae bacterium]MBT4688638.1 hypothetical protein [Rhodospirillaceae bacterium]MBT5523431.1 hypothetical protein [Rhodospirillaceae bacterium]MBT5882462.1 hypothetical protein [Rhodospirillaceae bacterium]MBT6591310.1 hypothetical protein [Rhodospirillaceae bacterium]
MVAINNIHEPFTPSLNQRAKGSLISGPALNGVATVPGAHAPEQSLGYTAAPIVDDQSTADRQQAILDSKALSGLQLSFGSFLAVLSHGLNTGAVSSNPDTDAEEQDEEEEDQSPRKSLAVAYPEPPAIEEPNQQSAVPLSQRDISLDILA